MSAVPPEHSGRIFISGQPTSDRYPLSPVTDILGIKVSANRLHPRESIQQYRPRIFDRFPYTQGIRLSRGNATMEAAPNNTPTDKAVASSIYSTNLIFSAEECHTGFLHL